MSKAVILTGQQRGILREAILSAYPNPDDLQILLSEQMNVQLWVIARGDAYNAKVFSLIQDFEADGMIEEFIRVVVKDKPQSPYLESITKEFAGINTPNSNPTLSQEKRADIQLVIDKTLEEDANVKQYREQVKEYLSDRRLEYYERAILDVLRDKLGLSSEKANQILEEELIPIYQGRQAYESLLKAVIKYYPFSDEVKSELNNFQAQWNLTDREVDEISQPILEQAEIAYQEKLQQQAQQEEKARERLRLQAVLEPQKPEETQPIVTPAPTSSILLSARGIDYSELAELLKQQKWKEADEVTFKVMLEVANRSSEGWLRVEDIDNFPCEDLQTIDQLWVNNSKGRFGFSVQAKIYRELGGTREYNKKVWNAFGDRVGWRRREGEKEGRWIHYEEVTFDPKASQGHLPVGGGAVGRVVLWGWWSWEGVVMEGWWDLFGDWWSLLSLLSRSELSGAR
jgi:hypothetical protein